MKIRNAGEDCIVTPETHAEAAALKEFCLRLTDPFDVSSIKHPTDEIQVSIASELRRIRKMMEKFINIEERAALLVELKS
jgi:hypothetical protein